MGGCYYVYFLNFFIFYFFPMSTIDDYWSMFVPPPVARGRLRHARSATTARGALRRSDWLRALISGGRY